MLAKVGKGGRGWGEILRHVDFEFNLQVTVSTPTTRAELLHSASRHGDSIARIRASRDLEIDVPIERRDLDDSSEERSGEGYRAGVKDIRALPSKLRMRLDNDVNVEVSALRFIAGNTGGGWWGVTLTGNTDPHTLLYSGGDVDINRARLVDRSAAAAGPAFTTLGDDISDTAAGFASSRHLEATTHEVDSRSRSTASSSRQTSVRYRYTSCTSTAARY